jgi:hypothetical protein
MLPPSWKGEIKEIIEEATNSASERQKDKLKRALDVATVILLFATALFTGLAWWIFRDQLIVLLPPKAIFNEIVIYVDGHDEITSFMPQTEITGSVSAVNTGRGPLRIQSSICMPYWRMGPLPMQRPYQVRDRNKITNKCQPVDWQDGSEIESGKVFPWTFKTVVPSNYVGGMKLYVLGEIIYRDQLNTRRATLMARYYDFDERRFLPIKDNPIYEGEE